MWNLYQKISSVLEEILKEKNVYSNVSPPFWEIPPQDKFGDLALTIALKLASFLKQNPQAIAQKIAEKLKEKLDKEIEKIEIVPPGFINIFFSSFTLKKFLHSLLSKDKNIFLHIFPKKKILLEFVSANPTGPLSIAHGRQAVIGDVLANFFEFLGNKVVREYYVNDVGRQISLLIHSVEERIKELKGEEFKIPEDGYHGEYVIDLAKEVLKKKPKDLEKFVISSILKGIKKDLEKIGVVFKSWVSQKELIRKKEVEKVIDLLKEKKLVYEKEKALWFSSTKFGDDKDRVLKKSDEEFTYFACDIAYHKNKAERGFDKLINLWGPDHHGYIKRVKSAFSALGFDENILNIIIVQLVSLKTKERMSKRKGKIFLLSDLVEEVGKEAARFYYLTRRNSSLLEFDIKKAKEISFDNPLYYIQYAHARICSIFRKAKSKKIHFKYIDFLDEEKEIYLLRKLFHFYFCLEKIYYFLEPVFLVEYLKELATTFHKFYEEERVIMQNKDKMYARLLLLKGVKKILSWGLNILGIKPKERM